MPTADVLTDEGIRRRRVAAQLLHRPRRLPAVDLVRHLLGVQAQDLPAARLAFRARIEGITPARVDRARFRDRSIVLTWAMRGTLHLVTWDDVLWLVPLTCAPRVANAHRRLREEGFDLAELRPAVSRIRRMLARNGPMTRSEIGEELRSHGLRAEGQALVHLIWLEASGGNICFGPERDGKPTHALTRDMLGDRASRAPVLTRREALQEIAVRYLRAHGPAIPEDLAAWSGLRVTDARRAWRGIGERLVEVPTERGAMWSLRGAHPSEPEDVVRLLPAFDEFLLGWTQRDVTASPADWKRINRGGGWLHPVLLHDGRAIGTWRWPGRARTPEVRPFGRLPTRTRPAIETEIAEIERFRAGDDRG